jgi:hypothetical protein
MTEYSRPVTQWRDAPTTAATLAPWSFVYDAGAEEFTLEEGAPVEGRSGLVLTAPGLWELQVLTGSEDQVKTVARSGDTIHVF